MIGVMHQGDNAGEKRLCAIVGTKKEGNEGFLFYSSNLWRQFVHHAGLEEKVLETFYLGRKEAAHDVVVLETQSFVLRNLFRAAVQDGAVRLPQRISPEHFTLNVHCSEDEQAVRYEIILANLHFADTRGGETPRPPTVV